MMMFSSTALMYSRITEEAIRDNPVYVIGFWTVVWMTYKVWRNRER